MAIYGDRVKCTPGVSSGAPCVKFIKTEILTGRFTAGESVRSIATDYDLTALDVEAAIRFELHAFAKWRPK